MKKIFSFILIGLFSSFIWTGVVFAQSLGESCGTNGKCDLPPECLGGVQIAGTCSLYEGVQLICCGPETKTEEGSTGNVTNKGFGFGTVKDVATQAGYNPGNEPSLDQRISSFIGIFLSLLGVIFMILMIYGGYTWMTAAGDEQKIDKAKDTIRAAVIGLVIVIAAYAISVFVISRLWGAGTVTQ